MGIATVFANVSCRDLAASEPWYAKLFGKAPLRRPMPGLAEWQFTDSAEVQLHQAPEHAGHSVLTLGVMPLEPSGNHVDITADDVGRPYASHKSPGILLGLLHGAQQRVLVEP